MIGSYELGPTGLRPGDLESWDAVGPSEVVFAHPFHPVLVKERLRLPDGSEADWLRHADRREGVSLPDAVGAVCERGDGKILVSYQWNLGPQEVVPEFPGGGVHPGETSEDAVAREVAEETGLRPCRVTFIGSHYYDNRRSPWRFRWFLATEFEDSDAVGDEVAVATEWLTPDELQDEIGRGAVQNQTMLAAWALYLAFKAKQPS
jgi:8-oxo-dGTP pyrophosphatase MutT (NUDIX family)